MAPRRWSSPRSRWPGTYPAGAFHQVREDGLLKKFKMLLLPHEEGVVGGQAVEDQLHIRRVLLPEQIRHEGPEIVVALLGQQG